MNTAVMERPPLVSVIGTIIRLSPAPAANRSGKIKLDNGMILSAFSDKLQQVEEGGTYDFGCVETNKGGVIYRDVKAVRAAATSEAFRTPPRQAQATQPVETVRYGAPAQAARQPAAVQRSAPVQQPHAPQPAPPNGNGNGYYRPTHPRDAERMFVCASLGHFIDRGAVKAEVGELVDAVNVLREVWRTTFGADPE